jgi:hypothetical protein
MSIIDKLRQGLRFVLMSMGISTPEKKPAKAGTPVAPKD